VDKFLNKAHLLNSFIFGIFPSIPFSWRLFLGTDTQGPAGNLMADLYVGAGFRSIFMKIVK